MKADLEQYLWEHIPVMGQKYEKSTRDVIAGMVGSGMIASAKQAWWTLEKWSRRGDYEYGTALDLGWKTRP